MSNRISVPDPKVGSKVNGLKIMKNFKIPRESTYDLRMVDVICICGVYFSTKLNQSFYDNGVSCGCLRYRERHGQVYRHLKYAREIEVIHEHSPRTCGLCSLKTDCSVTLDEDLNPHWNHDPVCKNRKVRGSYGSLSSR